ARARYRARDWRRDALSLLDRCDASVPWDRSLLWNVDDDKYFIAAYRFTMSSATVTSVEALLEAIKTTLDESFARSAFVTLTSGTNTHSFQVRMKTTVDLAQHVEVVRQRAKLRVFFDSIEGRGKQSSGWIPLKSETCEGGIYVICRAHEPQF